MKIRFIAILSLLLGQVAQPQSTSGGRAKWRDIAVEAIEEASQNPTREQILGLSPYLRVAQRGDQMEPEHIEVADHARNLILSLPHHADYFRDELERAINLEFAQARHEPGAWETRSDSLRYNVFKTLEQLPSPQVIALLGELLDDDRDPWKDWPASDTPPPNPNFYFACKALNTIGLQKAPVDDDLGNDAKIQAVRHSWQLWFAHVKAGTRTFRFEGDPLTYALSGPVQTKPAAIRPNRRDPLTAQETATESDGDGLPWFPVTLSLLLLAAGGWYLKARRTG